MRLHITLRQCMTPLLVSFVAMTMIFAAGGQVSAQTVQPDLLTAADFAVLGGSTVTNTGATVIGPSVGPSSIGTDVGVSPGSAITGFPPGVVFGAFHAADAVAAQAQADLTAAYNTLAGESPCALLPASLDEMTLTSGIYCFATSASLSSTLTLNLQGDPDALFVFQIPSTLITGTGARVRVRNAGGGSACNVWWQVGSSATLGTNTAFLGSIVALTSITMNTGATLLPGRALARNGAVTLDTNMVNMSACDPLLATSTPTPTNTPTNTPTPTPTPVPPTNTPFPTTVPGLPTLPGSVTMLPATGEHPDNRLPVALFAGLLLIIIGAFTFRRVRQPG